MKRAIVILSLITLSMILVFISCEKQDVKETKNYQASDVFLKSLEPDVIIKGSGNKEDYKKKVVEELVRLIFLNIYLNLLVNIKTRRVFISLLMMLEF